MSDALARQIIERQLTDKAVHIAADADRLAEAAAEFARTVRAGGHAGGALQLVQRAALLLHQAADLDGMREVATLLPKPTP